MKLCYLINQYPKVSHSFIRREILELERQGAQVLRVALRGWEQQVVDPQDLSEQGRTHYVLRQGIIPLLLAVVLQFLRRPARVAAMLRTTLSLSRVSDKSLAKHLVCAAEACRAAAWIERWKAAQIHAHFGTNSAEVALLVSRLTNIAFSFTVHGPEEFDHPVGLCLEQKIAHANHVVAISSYGRSQLYRWAHAADWPKIAVVHCGLDPAFTEAPVTPPAETDTLVCVGRLCEQKGQLLLIAALRQVLDRGCRCSLVLAGDGEMRPLIEQRAIELGVRDQVRITGWISESQVKQEIEAARALVLPSFAEGLPVVLMEALALGRPVISTYVAGIPELLMEGAGGWLVPAGDVALLADAMIRCLQSDSATLERLGGSGRQRVLESHDIRREVARLLSLFRERDDRVLR